MKLLDSDDPKLRRPSLEVPADALPDPDITALVAEMFLTLDEMSDAVALAAPQVGANYRIVVFDLGERGPRGHLINPVVLSTSRHQRAVTEGCLSFPGQLWRVRRSIRVDTTHLDKFGVRHTNEWSYFAAQMVQHELDHLDGVLLPDVALRKVASVRP